MADPAIAQQVGRVEGKVDALVERVSSIEHGQREARAQSTREHAEVRSDFQAAVERLELKLVDRLNKHADEIDDLQESRAKARMTVALLIGMPGVAAAVAAVVAYFVA